MFDRHDVKARFLIRWEITERQHRFLCLEALAELGLEQPESWCVQNELIAHLNVRTWRPADDVALEIGRNGGVIIHNFLA